MTIGARNTLTLSGASTGQVRVQVTPSVSGQATHFSFMGIGKWNGTANFSHTTATPIEVTFNNGQHGININAGAAPVWSDWINVSALTLNAGDKVVVCIDEADPSGYRTSMNNTNVAAAYSTPPTYNDATADNADSTGAWVFGISAIQTISVGGGGAGLQTVVNSDNGKYNATTNTPPDGCGRAIPFWAYDNPWNKGSLVRGTDYTETITCYADSFPGSTAISWNWPNTAPSLNVYSFAAVCYGQYGVTLPVTNITPSQINSINTLSLTHDVSLGGSTAQYGVIYSGALTSAANGGTNVAQFDLHLHAPSYVQSTLNALTPKYTFSDSQGTNWYIMDSPSDSPHKIVFIRQDMADLLSYTVDLRALLLQAKTRGLLTGAEYFNGLALGATPRTLSGTLTLNTFSASYATGATGIATIFTPSAALSFTNDDANTCARNVCTLSAASKGYIRVRFQPNVTNVVAIDSTATTVKVVNNPPSSPITQTTLTASASATAVVVNVSIGCWSGTIAGNSIAISSVTWGAQTMTQIGIATLSDGKGLVAFYGLVNPTSGNQTVSVNLTGNFAPTDVHIDAISLKGTDISSVANCFPSANVLTDVSTGGQDYPSSSFVVTTANGDMAIAGAQRASGAMYQTANTGTLIHFASYQSLGELVWAYGAATGSSFAIQFHASGGGNPAAGVAFRVVKGADLATDFTHMSIGKWNGTANRADTTATPIEVTFNNGGHGLSAAAGSASAWSDWINVSSLSLAAGDRLVVIIDNGSVGGYYSSNSNSNCYACFATFPGWATAGGSTDSVGTYCLGIAEIQTASSP